MESRGHMRCTNCGAENRDDARFCEHCGTEFVRICSRCGCTLGEIRPYDDDPLFTCRAYEGSPDLKFRPAADHTGFGQ